MSTWQPGPWAESIQVALDTSACYIGYPQVVFYVTHDPMLDKRLREGIPAAAGGGWRWHASVWGPDDEQTIAQSHPEAEAKAAAIAHANAQYPRGKWL
jgi:hypothetical protein